MAHRIYLVLLILVLGACANVVNPTGGAIDNTAPKIKSYSPENKSINFKGKSITISFDEFIDLKNAESQIIISPSLEKDPEYLIKGKTLVINFKSPLVDNTTYTINFGNALTDVHENNVLENFTYVFSTGSYVDSLFIAGEIVNAMTRKPEADIIIGIYKQLDDSATQKNKPDYFIKSSKEGFFRIENVANTKYQLLAFKDLNRNLKADIPSEQIAFVPQTIDAAEDSSINLELFTNEAATQKILNTNFSFPAKASLKFAKPLSKVKIKTLNTSSPSSKKEWDFIEYNEARDSVLFWFTDEGLDSLNLIVNTTNFSDTLRLQRFNKKKNPEAKTILAAKTFSNGRFKPGEALLISSNYPQTVYNKSHISIKEDTLPVNELELNADDSSYTHFSLRYPWKEDKVYTISVFPKAFGSMLSTEADTLAPMAFSLYKESEMGSLKLKLKAGARDRGAILLQLLSDKDEKIATQRITTGEQDLNFTNLLPGMYKIKAIYDLNDNGKWDTGNYKGKRLPEHTAFFTKDIQIRANWEVELEWKLD